MAPLSLSGIHAEVWPALQDADTLAKGASLLEGESVFLPVDALAGRDLSVAGDVYVQIEGDTDLGVLTPYLDRIKGLGIRFPAFNDGRGFTAAVHLRRDHGFQGEIRALGHVIPDQAQFLVRTGFDSADVPDARRAAFEAAADRYKQVYQADVRGRRGAGYVRAGAPLEADAKSRLDRAAS